MKNFLLIIGGAALWTASAYANIEPTFTSATTVAGITTYSYDVQVDAFQNLITGNELCIAGLTGLTGTPSAPAGWTAADAAGACPIAAGTTSPNVGPSVLYTYIASLTISGAADLGTFTYQSTNSTVGVLNDAFGATAQKKNPLSAAANQGELNGPASTVPEPANLSLFAAGLVGLGLLRRRIVRS